MLTKIYNILKKIFNLFLDILLFILELFSDDTDNTKNYKNYSNNKQSSIEKTEDKSSIEYKSLSPDEKKNALLKAALNGGFAKEKILNYTETNIFFHILKIINEKKLAIHCYPQVSCGEIFGYANKETNPIWFYEINPKRVDFCICNKKFEPLAVIEVQGSGHKLQKAWHLNDATKMALCNAIDIKFIQVHVSKSKSTDHLDKLTEDLVSLTI